MQKMRKVVSLLLLIPLCMQGGTFKVRNAAIKCDGSEPYQVVRAIGDLKNDIRTVTGSDNQRSEGQIVVGTYGKSKTIGRLVASGVLNEQDLKGKWESYVITVTNEKRPRLVIAGSDMRGTIYGIYDVSQRIGVSPWYWWADVPVVKNPEAAIDCDYYASGEPTVKYRGIFINDEDWGLKPWATKNYERELGDIGPKTYAKVCELLLRLKANMLAPAMHSCTGAFYSHPESKVVADSYGIVITTSHCEPLLLNNAAKSEWDQERDGDWNYKTNSATILKKWDDRLSEASQYENIYTTAMRGLHDAGLRGNLPMSERVPLIEQVFKDQRELLVKHKVYTPLSSGRGVGGEASIPQIFVPYKETMDIYENGLRVPDDITLVWVDDNYGYMKRVANPEEQQRSGRSGVYYHLSYLGAPHDYLWLNTTPPVLMYEELKKAYDHGADRYWLLNVGDIKPMELGMQTFFDMAWNLGDFDFEKARTHQAEYLAKLFGNLSPLTIPEQCSPTRSLSHLLPLLDDYYRLAWSRKPEFMGWEYEWDDKEHTGLKPTEYSFRHYDEAQQRLADYQRISDEVERLSTQLSLKSDDSQAAFFELLQFSVQGAYQMNRKFLMAQLNQELAAEGRLAEANWAARQMELAYDSIDALNRRYNRQLNGKWDGMMALSTSFTPTCQYYQKPEVKRFDGAGERPVSLAPLRGIQAVGCQAVDLGKPVSTQDVKIVSGLGYDGKVVQFGNPQKAPKDGNQKSVTYEFTGPQRDSVDIVLYTVPFWPLYEGQPNRVGVSVDGSPVQVFENKFKEYDRTWKDQVMRNGAVSRLRFAVDNNRSSHQLRLTGDPGQMVQRVIVDWGGLQTSYIGPALR